ncbi:MAG: bacteriohemerythrin [Desulfuromonadaceae bacterium]|jgi:hemerythrin
MIGIAWKDSYATQVGCFDAEHKKLVSLIDQYFQALREKRGLAMLEDLLGQLLEYTVYHFANEEKLMREHDYPHYQAHVVEHRKLAATVKGFRQMLGEAQGEQERDELLLVLRNFLREWLIGHISVEDKKYGPFFNEKGIF